jgi:tight adherence protein B
MVLIAVLAAVTVLALVYGIYLTLTRRKVLVAQRMETYAGIEEEAAVAAAEEMKKLSPVARALRTVLGGGYLQRVEEALAQADLPLKPSEYILLRLVLAGLAFLFGLYGLGYLHSGILLAILGYVAPAIMVRTNQYRRRAKFTRQLADALMLLTNSLRSGYSFLKGLELIAKEMSDPISKELNRMLREVNLGAPIEDALTNLGRRVKSEDLDIVISAYLVQKDIGGNLTEIMEKVAETIRERLRIQGDIKVLTAQGRLSGLIVGLLPLVVFFFIFMSSPSYFEVMLGPPIITLIGGLGVPAGVLMVLAALVLELIGAYLIFKIVSIKV